VGTSSGAYELQCSNKYFNSRNYQNETSKNKDKKYMYTNIIQNRHML